jgi:hypothetical protein
MMRTNLELFWLPVLLSVVMGAMHSKIISSI